MGNKVKEWTVLSMLEWATDYFKGKKIPDPRHSIEWLLAETLNTKRLDLYLKFDRPLSPSELDKLRPLVKRRAEHEPLQYIIGYSDFMNAHISVNPDVLIPRIETEQLVEIILDDHPKKQDNLSVLDIGTGSGCIPVALKMERASWDISGLDVSAEALKLARQNATHNEVDIELFEGNILMPESISISSKLDIIVSNPPYITPGEKETLEPQVRNYEPAGALFTKDMDKLYGQIIQFSHEHLSAEGALYLELHERYAEQIQQLFAPSAWQTTLQKDYDQKERFLIARPA